MHKPSATPHRPIVKKRPTMCLHKPQVSESNGTYIVESSVTKTDIL